MKYVLENVARRFADSPDAVTEERSLWTETKYALAALSDKDAEQDFGTRLQEWLFALEDAVARLEAGARRFTVTRAGSKELASEEEAEGITMLALFALKGIVENLRGSAS